MKKKILIMGLPGAGKTYLAKELSVYLKTVWLNSDKTRKEYNDWDFSSEGRERQAKRMKYLADKVLNEGKHVIADFICPTPKTRKDFNADIVIWLDTIKKGRYDDTNKIFIEPTKFDFRVTEKNAKKWSLWIFKEMKKQNLI